MGGLPHLRRTFASMSDSAKAPHRRPQQDARPSLGRVHARPCTHLLPGEEARGHRPRHRPALRGFGRRRAGRTGGGWSHEGSPSPQAVSSRHFKDQRRPCPAPEDRLGSGRCARGSRLPTQWIARVAFDLGCRRWAPDHASRTRRLKELHAAGQVERGHGRLRRKGTIEDIPVAFKVPATSGGSRSRRRVVRSGSGRSATRHSGGFALTWLEVHLLPGGRSSRSARSARRRRGGRGRRAGSTRDGVLADPGSRASGRGAGCGSGGLGDHPRTQPGDHDRGVVVGADDGRARLHAGRVAAIGLAVEELIAVGLLVRPAMRSHRRRSVAGGRTGARDMLSPAKRPAGGRVGGFRLRFASAVSRCFACSSLGGGAGPRDAAFGLPSPPSRRARHQSSGPSHSRSSWPRGAGWPSAARLRRAAGRPAPRPSASPSLCRGSRLRRFAARLVVTRRACPAASLRLGASVRPRVGVERADVWQPPGGLANDVASEDRDGGRAARERVGSRSRRRRGGRGPVARRAVPKIL